MTYTHYGIKDIPAAPPTLMDPARKLMAEREAMIDSRKKQSALLYSLSEHIRKNADKPMNLDPDLISSALRSDARNSSNILATESVLFRPGLVQNMNCESVQTRIIQETGRWCTHHGADIIMALSQLDTFVRLDTPDNWAEQANDWLIPMGMYDSGVHHLSFIMHELFTHMRGSPYLYPEQSYRRLLAVYIRDTPEHDWCGLRRDIILMDLTHEVYKPDENDLKLFKKEGASVWR